MKDIGKVGIAIIIDFVKSFTRASGTEVGKQVGKLGTRQEKERIELLKIIKETTEIVSNEHDWDVIDKNLHNAGQYIEAIIPAVATTFVAYVTIPVVMGAASFALIGTGVSAIVYTASNGMVLAGGAYKIVDNVMDVKSKKEWSMVK